MPDDCAVAWEMDAVHVDQTRPRSGKQRNGRIIERNFGKYSAFNEEALSEEITFTRRK